MNAIASGGKGPLAYQAGGFSPASNFSKYFPCFTSGRYGLSVCQVKIAAPLTFARLAISR